MLIRPAALVLLASAATLAVAQTPRNFTRVYGASDRDLPTPAHTAKTVTDAAALQSVLAFVKASGVTNWQGMTAEGMITYTGQKQGYPAHLKVLGDSRFRLDVDESKGRTTTLMLGRLGVFLAADGKLDAISPAVSTLGLVAFPRLLSVQYPTANSILTFNGAVTVGGKALERVTLDDPDGDAVGAPWITEDLYFDPATSLLAKSAALVRLSSSDSALYMLETDYSDYRSVNGVNLPHTIARSMNGQPSWTLTLTTIDTATPPSLAAFAQ